MKTMTQKMFNNLIHDLGTITIHVLKELENYDNVRVIPLSIVDNKQPYNIILSENGGEVDAKITYHKIFCDTDNITTLKGMLNKYYGLQSTKTDLYKLKTKIFKEEVTKLMLQYDLSISHEDTHGAFKIIPYNQDCVEWFNESEYNE